MNGWGYEPKWKHRECPCGCGEMADECMSGAAVSALGAFAIEAPVTSRTEGKANE